MMNEVEVIRCEEDAWQLLERLVMTAEDDRQFSVEFSGWPEFYLGIKGERYSSTLPGQLLAKLAKIQALSNSYYGRIVHDGDGRYLKKFEKQELELLFHVEKGSTEIKADLTAFLTKLSEALGNKKTSTKAAVVIVILALSISAAMVIPQLSEDFTNQHKERLELQKRALELAAEETDSSADFVKAYKEIISVVPDASSVQVGSSQFSAQEIRTISGERRTGQNVVLNNEFRIEGLRQYEHHFTLTTKSENGDTIRARVSKEYLERNPGLLEELSSSLTTDRLVLLTIRIREYEDGYGIGTVE